MDERQRGEIALAVERAMRSFEAAERGLDAERLLGHFAPVPDFHVYNDGQRVSYAAMAEGVRTTFPTLRSIEGGFSELHVIVLSPDAALTTTTFREAVTDGSGPIARQRGAASWLWRRIDDQWRIVYGHVDHYPEGTP